MSKFWKLWTSGAVVALALGVAASAEADIVTVTYQGVVKDGQQWLGGSVEDLTGKSFTMVYSYDLAGTPYSRVTATSPLLGVLQTGGGFGLFGSFVIDGVSYPSGSGGGSDNSVYQPTPASSIQVIHYIGEDYIEGGNLLGYWTDKDDISSHFDPLVRSIDGDTVSFQYTFQAGDTASGTLEYWYFINPPFVIGDPYYYIDADYDITSMTISGVPLAYVPEPATWTMLILGLAIIGFAARRRNGSAAVAV